MEYKDYYEIMGIKRDATQDGIKRAYHKLVIKYHPDVSQESDAEERCKSVGETLKKLCNGNSGWVVLSDNAAVGE